MMTILNGKIYSCDECPYEWVKTLPKKGTSCHECSQLYLMLNNECSKVGIRLDEELVSKISNT
jgi:hypothetical protein